MDHLDRHLDLPFVSAVRFGNTLPMGSTQSLTINPGEKEDEISGDTNNQLGAMIHDGISKGQLVPPQAVSSMVWDTPDVGNRHMFVRSKLHRAATTHKRGHTAEDYGDAT